MIPRLRLSDGAGSASGRTQESVAAAGCPGQPKAGPGRALIILAGRGPPRCSGLLSILATQPQLPLTWSDSESGGASQSSSSEPGAQAQPGGHGVTALSPGHWQAATSGFEVVVG